MLAYWLVISDELSIGSNWCAGSYKLQALDRVLDEKRLIDCLPKKSSDLCAFETFR